MLTRDVTVETSSRPTKPLVYVVIRKVPKRNANDQDVTPLETLSGFRCVVSSVSLSLRAEKCICNATW